MTITNRAHASSDTTYQYDGIYLPLEASGYLLATMPMEAHPPTSRRIIRWIRHGLVAPERRDTPGRELTITFEDLVTCQAVTVLREAGLSLDDVLRAERYFASLFGTARPFAHHDFWYSGSDVFGRVDGVLVAGSKNGQIAFNFIESWLARLNRSLGFSETSHQANCWQPVDGVTLRPNVQLGQPCVEGTRIPTSAIWSYVVAGDSPTFIANAYGLEVGQVERAVAWEERVRAALEPTAEVSA